MAADGQHAAVHVVVRLADDGTVVETTDVDVALEAGTYDAHRDYRPVEFTVGAGEVVPAVEDAVREMTPGDQRTVTVDSADVVGPRREDAVVAVDRERLEARSDVTADPGEFVVSDRGDLGVITAVDGDRVTVDFNHDLAGEPLVFEVRLVDVSEGEKA